MELLAPGAQVVTTSVRDRESPETPFGHVGAAVVRRGAPSPPYAPTRVTMHVAAGFSDGPLALGLDRPLELRGGDRLAPDQLVYDLAFTWQVDLIRLIDRACRERLLDGQSFLTLPPLLLTGEPGVGRTHAARRIASLAGLPHVQMHLGDATAQSIQARSQGPDVVLPAPPVLAMAASGCANPVITVIGVDEVDRDTQEWLAALVDPSRSSRWIEEGVGAVVDLSRISWFVQSNAVGDLAPALVNALRLVELVRPSPAEFDLHLVDVLAEVVADRGMLGQIQPWVLTDALTAMRRAKRASTAALYVAADQALACDVVEAA